MKLSDLVHIVFGFLAGFIWEISTACTLLYAAYQWREPEKLTASSVITIGVSGSAGGMV